MKKILKLFLIFTITLSFFLVTSNEVVAFNPNNPYEYFDTVLLSGDKIISISMVGDFSSALSSTGRVFTWGRATYGVLGDGQSSTDRTRPVEITTSGALNNLDTGDKIIAISMGGYHSSALSSTGRVFTWGFAGSGRLGDGQSSTDRTSPVEITTSGALNNLDSGDKIISISMGGNHSSALSSTGRVFTWGRSTHGIIGDGQITTNRESPVEITTSGSFDNLDSGDKIISISLGQYHSSALSSTGRVFTWGNAANGRLGDGQNSTDRTRPVEITTSGALNNLDSGDKIKAISMGLAHSSALSSTGRVFTWGSATNGKLGDGQSSTDRTSPVEITTSGALDNLDSTDKINAISMGNTHSSASSSYGRVFTWGGALNGRLGDGQSTTDRTSPVEITTSGALDNLDSTDKIIAISTGFAHSSALSSTGRVFTWGSAANGRLGDGQSSTDRTSPVELFDIEPNPILGYTVTFESNGGTAVSPLEEVEEDSLIDEPTPPTRAGYLFYGWYKESVLTNPWNFSTDKVTADITLYAKWIQFWLVEFDSNGGSSVSSQQVKASDDWKATEPSDPTRVGYKFDGWFAVDGEIWVAIDFDDAITANRTFTAKWLAMDDLKITFETNGGTAVDPIADITYGTAATAPTSPTRVGYDFQGWYSDEELTSIFSFSTLIFDDMTLYAKWLISNYIYTFEVNGGSMVAPIDVNHGSVVDEPEAPVREGYVFQGWYLDDGTFELEYSFPDIASGNITVYALWAQEFTISFFHNNALFHSITGLEGTAVSAPTPNPTLANHRFDGWYLGETLYVFGTMPGEDINLYAKMTAYYIVFDSDGGSSVSVRGPIYPGTIILQPSAPTKSGYLFAGWFTDQALTTSYNWFTPINQDYLLYAKWITNQVDEFTVTFETNEGSFIAPVAVVSGELVTKPTNPTKPGYTFIGWYRNVGLTVPFLFNEDVITGNLTLYAAWEEVVVPIEDRATEVLAVYGILIAVIVVIIIAVVAFLTKKQRRYQRNRKYRRRY